MTSSRHADDVPVSRGAAGPVPSADRPDSVDTARYIAAMSAELSVMARRVDLDLLAYFLEMARMEAAAVSKAERRSRRGVGSAALAGPDAEA